MIKYSLTFLALACFSAIIGFTTQDVYLASLCIALFVIFLVGFVVVTLAYPAKE